MTAKAPIQPCAIDGCERPREGWKLLCATHMRRERRNGYAKPQVPIRGPGPKGGELCIIDGCGRPRRANTHGLCRSHQERFLTTGDPQAGKPIRKWVRKPRPDTDTRSDQEEA